MNSEKISSWKISKRDMQELLELCPCESEYHFDKEENSDWIKLAESPTCNYPKLCEKMLSILNNSTFLRIRKEVAVNVFDGKHDQVLTGFLSKKSADTYWHTDNKCAMQHTDLRTFTIRVGGRGEVKFVISPGYTIKDWRKYRENKKIGDDDWTTKTYKYDVGTAVLFPCFCQHSVIQMGKGERINLIVTVCFKSTKRSGCNIKPIHN